MPDLTADDIRKCQSVRIGKRKPLINLRKWGKQLKLSRNTRTNEKLLENGFNTTEQYKVKTVLIK